MTPVSLQPQSHHHDPEKGNDPTFSRLTPVPSSTSTVEEAIDAEAGFANAPAVSVASKDEAEDPGPPPNGGAQAWLQVLGSFFLFFNCW